LGSAMDLTFASVFPRVVEANVKSKPHYNHIVASVPLILTFVTSSLRYDTNVRTGTLAALPAGAGL
jgi:hypothetical protein